MKSKVTYVLEIDGKEIIAEVTAPYNSPADDAYLTKIYKEIPLKDWRRK